jgi:N-acetylmuramoyl-L-alanine amidase
VYFHSYGEHKRYIQNLSTQFALMKAKFLFPLLTLFLSSSVFASSVITDIKTVQNRDLFNIIFQTNNKTSYKISSSANQSRLIIDIKDAIWKIKQKTLQQIQKERGLIRSINYEQTKSGDTRVMLDLMPQVTLHTSSYQKKGNQHSFTFTFRAKDNDNANFDPIIDFLNTQDSNLLKKNITSLNSPIPHKEVVIVIDPGHGGNDPGAIGSYFKSYEKDITLKYARELQKLLSSNNNYKIVLTRNEDLTLPLPSRVAIAEQVNADIFISLHANFSPNPATKGASIYTLSDQKPSESLSSLFSDIENQHDLIKNTNLSEEHHDIAGVLVDLATRDKKNNSADFANQVVKELSSKVKLLKQTHRFANFMVLRSVDIPAILVELGHISNLEEEILLNSESHCQTIVKALGKAINTHFAHLSPNLASSNNTR